MSGQAPQYFGTKSKIGEERRWRENTISQSPRPMRHGMCHKSLPSGTYLEPLKTRRPASIIDNFKVTVTGGMYRVREGTIRGATPTLNGLPITSEDAAGELIGSGTEYVWIEVSVVYVLNSGGDYVVNFTDPVYVIKSGVTAPDLLYDKSSGIFQIQLARIVNGVVQRPQPVRNSLDYFIEDDNTGSAAAEIFIGSV